MQYIIRLEWFIILVLLQVLVLNHIHFEQYATPLFYIYFLLKIDSDNSRKGLMLWAFFFRTLHRYFQQYTRIKTLPHLYLLPSAAHGFSDCFPCVTLQTTLNQACIRWDLLHSSDIQ